MQTAIPFALAFSLFLALPAASQPADNERLIELYEADQADRSGQIDWDLVHRRDSLRQRQVEEILEAGEVRTANDYFHAAMIFQHGGTPEDFWLAHNLAETAAELDSSMSSAKWLSAASWDRYLLSKGEPQIYGTQYLVVEGKWYVRRMDTVVVNDEKRRQLGVRTLEEIRERLREKNNAYEASLDPPPVQIETR